MIYWNKELAFAAAEAFKIQSDFERDYSGAVKWLKRKKLFKEATSHMVKRMTKTKSIEIGKTFSSRSSFYTGNRTAYNYALKYNLLDSIFKGIESKWSEEKVFSVIHEYKTITDFKNRCAGGFTYCKRNDLLDKVRKHFKGINK